jgi:hypothetical protein
VEAIVVALQGASASDKVVTKRLRQLGRSINNQQRATLARRVFRVGRAERRAERRAELSGLGAV